MPPAAPSTTLSVSIWRTSRRRGAPSAERTAISDSRDAARASSRFARFVHVISSTNDTAPISTKSAVLDVAHDRLVQRPRRQAHGGIGFRILLLEPSGDRRELRTRLLEGCAVAQPSDRAEKPGAAVAVAEHLFTRVWHPDLASERKREPCRHDTDDGVRDAVERDRSVERVAAAPEALLPERLTDDGDLLFARRVLIRTEDAAERRPRAKDVEKAGADPDALQTDRLSPSGQRHFPFAVRRGGLDRLALVAGVVEIGGRHRCGRPFPHLRDRDQPIRLLERQRLRATPNESR